MQARAAAAHEIRTLFVTRNAPYPPSSGAPVRNWVNINAMKTFGPVAVFSVGELEAGVSALPGVAAWRHHGDGEVRSPLMRAVGMFRRLFKPREFHVSDERYARELSQSLHEFARDFRPDVTVLENWLDAFPAILHGVAGKIVVDAHNIESLLQSEMLRRSKNPLLIARSYIRWFFAKDIERRLFESADEVWLTSRDDLERLNSFTRRPVPCRIIPNAVDVERYAAVRTNRMHLSAAVPRQPHSLCFVGLFQHPPNAQAAQLLIDEIFPRLRERFADARLVLVGREPTACMQRAARRDPAIVVTGYVADTRSYLAACDLTVVPIATGGGTRLKILEAFASGIPVVSTRVGAEGLAVRDGEQLLIRETVEDLVDAAASVWQNRELAASLTERAYALVAGAYSSAAISEKMRAAATMLLERGEASSDVRLRSRVCVAVPTFRRPEQLVELLRNLALQEIDLGRYDLRFVVIDNDVLPTAEANVCAARALFAQRLDYVHVPEPGLSTVRNAALEYAAGRFDVLAMIDDDEVPEPEWLSELLRVRELTGADAVIGPVPTRFPAGTPKWVTKGRFFELPRFEDGTELRFGITGNCLLAVDSIASLRLSFDRAFSISGGEDTLFFTQMRARGGRIVYAAKAVAVEVIPLSRTRLRYIAARRFGNGNSHARCELQMNRRPGWSVCIVLFKGLLLMMWSLSVLPPRIVLCGRAGAVQTICDVSRALGKLAAVAGFKYLGYSRRDETPVIAMTAVGQS